MKTVVSEKGQITIPKPLRNRLGLTAGIVIEFEARGGELCGRKRVVEDPVQRWRGKGRLPQGLSVDAYLDKVRG